MLILQVILVKLLLINVIKKIRENERQVSSCNVIINKYN